MKKSREKITKPGVAKVPVIMQMEAMECGAACLDMLAAYYGKWIPLEEVRRDCGVSRDGSKAGNIARAARSYGMDAKIYRFSASALKKTGRFPCIIHWNMAHFVVLNGFQGDKVSINDPAQGRITVPFETFDKSYTGITIEAVPNESFRPGGERTRIIPFIKEKLKGTAAVFAVITISTSLASLAGIITPAFSSVFVDRLLSGENPEWLISFISLMTALSIVTFIIAWIRISAEYKMQGKIASVSNASYVWHILRLPMSFFSQRQAGDIMSRKAKNQSVAYEIVTTIAPLLIQGCMLIFYLAVMLRYSPLLTLIGLVSVFLNIAIGAFVSGRRVDISRVSARNQSMLYSMSVSAIDMIESIKASGAEEGYFNNWAGVQANASESAAKATRLNVSLGLLPQAVSALTSTLILILGIGICMSGRWTVGTLTAFGALLSSFGRPAKTVALSAQRLLEMKTDIERIRDVMKYPAEIPMQDEPLSDDTVLKKLSGKVELKNVSFGYMPLEKPLIENFSLTIEKGQKVAIVGGSGSGKSTIARLLAGLFRPWSGEILYDGIPVGEIPRDILSSSLGVVDQDILLFEDTVSNNIRFWDPTVSNAEIIQAAKDARIHDDIMQRDGGYEGGILEGGGNFSGGQKQRLEIARVLAQDPGILILDEATSALDARTEYEVVQAIQKRGITCIVVAHRLSTIRDSDLIIVMDHGKEAERGTHEELYAKGGIYHDLVSNE